MGLKINIMLLVLLVSILLTSCGMDGNKVEIDKSEEPGFHEISLERVDSMIVGSEFPLIIYADEEKVIVNGLGIFIYDINEKTVTDSLDIWRFANKLADEENDSDIRPWVISNNDGSELYISFENYMNFNDNYAHYFTYSISDKFLLEISRNEYEILKEDAFDCNYSGISNELNSKSIGTVAELENGTLIYLNMLDNIIGELEVIYLKEEIETRYKVFK